MKRRGTVVNKASIHFASAGHAHQNQAASEKGAKSNMSSLLHAKWHLILPSARLLIEILHTENALAV